MRRITHRHPALLGVPTINRSAYLAALTGVKQQATAEEEALDVGEEGEGGAAPHSGGAAGGKGAVPGSMREVGGGVAGRGGGGGVSGRGGGTGGGAKGLGGAGPQVLGPEARRQVAAAVQLAFAKHAVCGLEGIRCRWA
jgi:hypothetical protein